MFAGGASFQGFFSGAGFRITKIAHFPRPFRLYVPPDHVARRVPLSGKMIRYEPRKISIGPWAVCPNIRPSVMCAQTFGTRIPPKKVPHGRWGLSGDSLSLCVPSSRASQPRIHQTRPTRLRPAERGGFPLQKAVDGAMSLHKAGARVAQYVL